ncbi:hypothetical protein SAMN05444695_11321 [Rhodococcus triatomae]|uniref:Peptidase M50 n=1 Tax=Rhodococcus triatomae TaxID=300028 RepID=A0A1G8PI61_9NOCA|nr:hypothetical protein SAMN05444695_11321 [Rhodococcus triatomae]
MTPVVLICGDAPLPLALGSLSASSAPAVPEKDDFDEVFSKLQVTPDPRLVVVGSDAAFAAALTRLMRTERLHVELAYVAERRSPATDAYQLATGAKAASVALEGKAREVPLIRDDAGIALVGAATLTGPSAGELVGEAYVDDTRLFSGVAPRLNVAPVPAAPGLRAAVDRRSRWLPRRWVEGRAVQLGSPEAALVRDGVPNPRMLKRSTFYRHEHDWLLVG